jgi:hypothetical protein
MLIVMSVLTGLQIVADLHHGKTPAYIRLFSAKLVLVAVAVGAEWLLAPVTSESNTIVAAGLVVLITAAGPALDRLATRRAKAKAAARSDQAHRSAGLPAGASADRPADPARSGQAPVRREEGPRDWRGGDAAASCPERSERERTD